MFTGIVESVGTISRIVPHGSRIELEIQAGPLAEGAAIGSSIAVSGCCLTVTRASAGVLAFEAVPETLRLTALGERREGDRVNLERALRADARLDGHIVQGHVDGTGRIRALERTGDDVRMAIECAPAVAELLVAKGSVTVDGVSLTVVDPRPDGFAVALIPHTLSVTTLGERAVGDRVNLEADVLGKYVRHFVQGLGQARET